MSGLSDSVLDPLLKIVNHVGMMGAWKESNTVAFDGLFGAKARYPMDATTLKDLDM